MRRMRFVLAALGLLAAVPAWATFTGSLYYTDFNDHHVRRIDFSANVPGPTTDLGQSPGADGIIFDPSNINQLLVAGQVTNNVYTLPTTGGAFVRVNQPNASIQYGAFHLATFEQFAMPVPEAYQRIQPAPNYFMLATGQEGASPNGLGLVNLTTGATFNKLIANTAMNRVSGIAVRQIFDATPARPQADGAVPAIYITDSPNTGVGGQLYTVNWMTGVATLVNVQSNGALASHDLHGLWLDKMTGHLFGTGMKHVEEIDLDALGGPQIVRDWDLSALIPEAPGGQGHTDQVSSDDFGNLFVASNSGEIVYLDLNLANPVPTTLKTVKLGLDDMVVGPPAIPEPSTLLLAGLGLVGLAVFRKRG